MDDEEIYIEDCPACGSEDIKTFCDPCAPLAHMTCNVCGETWQEETTSWAEQENQLSLSID